LLEGEGFEVLLVEDGEMAIEATFSSEFDIFLLDVNVPLLNGFDFLKELRESGNKTAAIFITSLSDVASLSRGFDAGGDDYIKKPFDFDELVIRINALLRKSYNSYKNELEVGKFKFFIDKNELFFDSIFIALSPYELQITKLLFQHLNQTLQKHIILEHLNEGHEMSEGALRVHINKLRKIGLPITTIKGIGYRLAQT
jgi:DNA-binding response OmpR family regulator